jgi:hypothetical protein
MAQYNITATSAKANDNQGMTVSNTNTKKFPSPAEFETQELADENAKKYAKDLNHDDHQGVWDWVATATAV